MIIGLLKILLNGCAGRMGQSVISAVSERDDCEIVAGIDSRSPGNEPFPVFTNPEEFYLEADVIIDFSHVSCLLPLLKMAVPKKIPVVIATTGFGGEELTAVKKAAQEIPVFMSANMSIGINLISRLARQASEALYGRFDIEIVEKHHNQKLDAPSGTALLLANEIASVIPDKIIYETNRADRREKRPKQEIGLHSIRGGSIVGDHDIIFAGSNEVVTLSHRAESKSIFAEGAIAAAKYIAGKKNGIFNMDDMLSGK